MNKSKLSKFTASITGLILSSGLSLSNNNPADAATIRNGEFNLTYTTGILEGKNSSGSFKFEESPSFYDGLQMVRVNEGLRFLEFNFEGQIFRHVHDAYYPFTPQIKFWKGKPWSLDLHLKDEQIIGLNNDLILTLDLVTNYEAVYSIKNYETNALPEIGEGKINIQILGIFGGLGVFTFATSTILSSSQKAPTKSQSAYSPTYRFG